MPKKIDLSQSRILISAIMLSLAWHLFWLSAIKVVSAPSDNRPMRFSRVSFLGPLLSKGAAEIRVGPQARTGLEKRYLAKAAEMAGRRDMTRETARTGDYAPSVRIPKATDAKIAGFIGESLGAHKLEPISLAE